MLMARPPTSTLLDAARFVSRRSVHDLALETGYHVRTIQEALWGVRKRPGGVALEARPTLGVIVALARALNLSPDRLRKAGRDDAAIALELLGDEFDFSRVPTAALVAELSRRTGGPEVGSWQWVAKAAKTNS